MKTLNSFLITVLLGTVVQAQTLYTGISSYTPGVNAVTSTGSITVITHPGFVIGSYVPLPATNDPHMYIHGTDVDGNFNGSTGEFFRYYTVTNTGTACAGGQVKESTCSGLSLIETNVPSGSTPPVPNAIWYATASSYDNGVLFAGLGTTGIPSTSAFYTYPHSPSGSTKPLICESFLNAQTYFICGSYNHNGRRYMFVMRVDAAGTQVWSKTYDFGTGTIIEPRAIIESPYSASGNNELIVVGAYADASSGLGSEGFFCKINDSMNGTVNSFITYGNSNNSNERFSSISVANSSAVGPAGFIVGGYTDLSTTNGSAWMLKLTNNGGISWNTRIEPTSDNTAGDVVGVKERYSNAYSQYEYYGTLGGSPGMIVLKLDETGAAFTNNGTNEFLYNLGSGAPFAAPAAISFMDMGGVNDGIHVFGTDDNSGPGQMLMVQACFSGHSGSGCNANYTTLASINNGPTATANLNGITVAGGIQSCQNFALSYMDSSPQMTSLCSLTSKPLLGDQSRLFLGVDKTLEDFPLAIAFKSGDNSIISVTGGNASKETEVVILDMLGNVLQISIEKNTSETDIEIRLAPLNLQEGVYLIRVSKNGKSTVRKFLVIH